MENVGKGFEITDVQRIKMQQLLKHSKHINSYQKRKAIKSVVLTYFSYRWEKSQYFFTRCVGEKTYLHSDIGT